MQLFERSIYCGEVNENFLGKEVFLAGWVRTRRDHGGLIFVDLEDRTGRMQLVFNPDIDTASLKRAHSLRMEFVISVRGMVVSRSPQTINKNLKTGTLELQVHSLSIVNKSLPLPFQLEDAENTQEELRLKHRYLDLRRESMQHVLKLRSDVMFLIREYLTELDFLEVETPILSKSTPEGARDFLVPSRLHLGSFYALPQSPQIYKQLLMAGSIDKYFQIARCFRDEDLRANRQPEFTQLDIEMSFIQESDIRAICEGIIQKIWKYALNHEIETPITELSYDAAFSRFGSDAPDMRFALEIHDVTPLFKTTELSFLQKTIEKSGKVGALCVKNIEFSRSQLDSLVTATIEKLGAKGLLYIRFNEDGTPDSPVSKFLPEDFLQQARNCISGLTASDTLFLVAGPYESAWTTLGKLRIKLGNKLNLIDQNSYAFTWIVDFPLFVYNKDEQRFDSVHHPFTQPKAGWEKEKPKNMKARAYDLVCNGQELGGGSIRIHDAQMQEKIFELIGVSKKQSREKFGFLLDAQQLGYPPHGGVAFGLDRIMMILSKSQSIRDVIAFPKTQSGNCPLMETPSNVEKNQLSELHIRSTFVAKE